MNYISQIPDWSTLTAEECHGYLLTVEPKRKPVVRGSSQSAGVGYLGTAERVQAAFPALMGPAALAISEGIYQHFLSIGATGGAIAYSASADGLDFGDKGVQDQLDEFQFAEQLPEELHEPLRQLLKSFGYDFSPNWQRLGLSEAPTLEQVARDLEATHTLAWWHPFEAGFIQQEIQAGRLTSKAEVVAAIDSTLEGE